MKTTLKKVLLGIGVALAIPTTWALADWTARDSSGATVTFNALTTAGGKILPKHVVTDATGAFTASVSSGGAMKVDASGTTVGATQSGTWSVGVNSSLPAGSNVIGGVTQSGSPWGMNLAQVNGAAPSAANPLPAQLSVSNAAVDTTNPLPTRSGDSLTATYSVGASWVLGSTPTDMALVQGSASKVIKIRRIFANVTQATAANTEISLIRRSSGNTSGVPTVQTAGKFDTTDPGASAVVTTYAGTATTGTTVATLFYTIIPGSTGTTLGQPTDIRFGTPNGDKPIILRGTGEYLGIATSTTAGGGNMRLTIEWTEE